MIVNNEKKSARQGKDSDSCENGIGLLMLGVVAIACVYLCVVVVVDSPTMVISSLVVWLLKLVYYAVVVGVFMTLGGIVKICVSDAGFTLVLRFFSALHVQEILMKTIFSKQCENHRAEIDALRAVIKLQKTEKRSLRDAHDAEILESKRLEKKLEKKLAAWKKAAEALGKQMKDTMAENLLTISKLAKTKQQQMANLAETSEMRIATLKMQVAAAEKANQMLQTRCSRQVDINMLEKTAKEAEFNELKKKLAALSKNTKDTLDALEKHKAESEDRICGLIQERKETEEMVSELNEENSALKALAKETEDTHEKKLEKLEKALAEKEAELNLKTLEFNVAVEVTDELEADLEKATTELNASVESNEVHKAEAVILKKKLARTLKRASMFENAERDASKASKKNFEAFSKYFKISVAYLAEIGALKKENLDLKERAKETRASNNKKLATFSKQIAELTADLQTTRLPTAKIVVPELNALVVMRTPISLKKTEATTTTEVLKEAKVVVPEANALAVMRTPISLKKTEATTTTKVLKEAKVVVPEAKVELHPVVEEKEISAPEEEKKEEEIVEVTPEVPVVVVPTKTTTKTKKRIPSRRRRRRTRGSKKSLLELERIRVLAKAKSLHVQFEKEVQYDILQDEICHQENDIPRSGVHRTVRNHYASKPAVKRMVRKPAVKRMVSRLNCLYG